METLLLISRVELVVVMILSLCVPLVFGIFAGGYKKTRDGRILMGGFIAFAVALSTSALTLLLGLTLAVIVLRVVVYAGLIILLIAVLATLIQIQETNYRAGRKK